MDREHRLVYMVPEEKIKIIPC
ncbi:MAG: type II toxin-antitoxin system YoeB family toxin, partial [bacterium]|nr:type II toxin-antitoxin system YoeB family toxin [bacterium]